MSRKLLSVTDRGGFGRPSLLVHQGAGRAALLTAGFICCLGANAAADSEANLRAELERCGRIAERGARLLCYDNLLDAGSGAEQRFGGDTISGPPPDPSDDGPQEVERIESTIERLERRPRGEYVFHLANGQIWTEVSSGRTRYRTGMDVEIERTLLGGYMLSTDSGRATRVRRLR